MELILTHSNADFDALASLLAAARLFPGALPVLPQRLNRNLHDFLAIYRGSIPFVEMGNLPREPVTRLILVDTQQVPTLPFPMGPFVPQIEIFDHHPLSRPLAENERYLGRTVGAAVSLLVPLLIERRESLSPLEATLLLLGIYEDTGSLSFPGTTPEDMRSAAWCLEQGANLHIMAEFLTRPLTEGQLKLYNQLVSTARIEEIQGWPVVVAWAEIESYVEEISTLAHRLVDLYDPAALFLVVQLGGTVQLVARSRGEAVSASEIMAHFGGGGHSRAAAAFLSGWKAEQVREELLQVLREKITPMRTAADIMTVRIHTIAPQATLAEASEVMSRYGHGSLPVVDGRGRLVGLFTRRDLDRALHHRLDESLVSTYMWRGPVTISPETPVDRVRQTMVENDVGRLLVIDEDRSLLGIVSRTDLLKLWPEIQPQVPGPRDDWALELEQALPQTILEIVRQAGQVAEEVGFSLYLVGGFVRDMLLKLPNLDLDLVVEGDAIAMARELARRMGGRVRSHRRFGTAKWILERPEDELPQRLDFVTARTEFYEEPSALPTVEFSSLRHDLYRRDFTINTLAIGLSGAQYGRLFDFFGGKRDLDRRLVRVLHNLSFIEDPTRILRAVRLEQRLDFSIEPRTLMLLHDAVQQRLLERTTGERIRHELFLILQEEEPERALARLHELGVLERLSPQWVWDGWLSDRFPQVRQGPTGAEDRANLYLALLCYRLPAREVERLIARYRFRARSTRLLREMIQLRAEVVPALRADPPPHRIYRLLRPFSGLALNGLLLAEEEQALQEAIGLYRERLRYVRTALSGDDLRAAGLAPGPLYKELLGKLLDARLDGLVSSREEEEALLAELLGSRP